MIPKNHQASLISGYLSEKKDQIIALLVGLVEEESPSTHPASQIRVLKLLEDAFVNLDFETSIVPGDKTGGYLFGRPKTRTRHGPFQLLIGHCDTVWPMDALHTMPLSSTDEIMKGPGIYDMKGGLVQMIFALDAVRDLGLNQEVTPLVLINSDEEIGSHESKQAISRLARISERAFILEPSLGSSGQLKTSRKGVGRYAIKITGKAAHAGLEPGKGVSAIVALSYIIQKLCSFNDPEKEVSVNVGMVEGGIRPNVVAPESSAVVDVRVPNLADAKKIHEKIMGLTHHNPDILVEVDGNIGRPPMEPTPRNRQLWELARGEGKKLGLELEEAAAGGASDGNTTSLYTATLDGLGAIGGGAHASHEFLFMDKLIERTALLTLLLSTAPLQQSQTILE